MARTGDPLIVEGHHGRDLELAADRDEIPGEPPPMLHVSDIRSPEIQEFSDQALGNRVVGGRPEPLSPRKTDQPGDENTAILGDSDRRLGRPSSSRPRRAGVSRANSL
jgi:hypothetical protein